jgi:hypothetical protein
MSNSTFPPIANRFEVAADKAKEGAAIVGDATSQAVHVARDLASEAGCAVGSMASQAACDVGQKANDLTASAGASIKGLGDKLSQNAPHTGMVGNASQSMAKAVHDGGQYMEDAKFSGMVEDVAQLIRRNPIPAVFLAIGLGWVVARKMRS